MTKIEALKLAVENWRGGRQHGKNCALCELYDADECFDCPLFKKWGQSCTDKGSLFRQYRSVFGYRRLRNAYGRQIWNDLKELYEEELKKEARDD